MATRLSGNDTPHTAGWIISHRVVDVWPTITSV